MNFRKLVRKNSRLVERFVSKESPTILTAFGVTGLITTVVLAVKATPKALYIMDREYYSRESIEPLTKIEIIKLTWQCYIPTFLSGGMTIGCIIASNHINLRRNAALLSLYTITTESLKEYQDQVVELLGKNKESNLRDEISQKKLDKDPLDNKQVIITGNGETLFYDSLSGRYFKSDIELLRRRINDFNATLLGELYQTLNEWYDIIQLEGTNMGRDVGWEANDGLLEIIWSAKIATNGQPCIVLEYRNGPKSL